jgi:hypothetical protein
MDAHYRIIFTGRLIPGKHPQAVTESLAARFRVPMDKSRDVVLGGVSQVLKRNLDAARAERYRMLLTDIGLEVRVEPQEDGRESLSSQLPELSSLTEAAGQPADSSAELARGQDKEPRGTAESPGSRCPKYGSNDVSGVTGVCQSCGLVVERYLARQVADRRTGGRPADAAHSGRPALAAARLDMPVESLRPPRPLPAGRGWAWIADGWALFKERPWAWIGALVLVYLILILLSLVPWVGGLAVTIVQPILTAGLMIGAHAQLTGGRFEVGHLFAGFQVHAGRLALLGLVYLLLAIGVGVVTALGFLLVLQLTGGLALEPTLVFPEDPGPILLPMQAPMEPVFLIPVLIGLLIGVTVTMVMLFAPALVALNAVPVLRALKLSFLGCLKNVLPFLVFGLAALGLLLLGSLPMMLGLLVVVPVLVIALYMAYRDIFYR